MEKLVDTIIAFTVPGRLARGRSVSTAGLGHTVSRSPDFPARTLICHWRPDASGALVCVWSTDDPSAAGDNPIATYSRAA